jgi:Zn-dependent protease
VPSRSAITLLHFRGIRIGVDYSWFVVLFLLILWQSGFYRDVLGENHDGAAYALAVASALLFFISILLHELGHALVAIRKGIGISAITLWMFGGVAVMERDSDSPATEFKIAIAGPVVTALIAAVCALVGVALEGSEFWDAVGVLITGGSVNTSGIGALVAFLAWVNAALLIFNLIPAFPLDGGRIARAIAWWRTGDRRSATRIAASLGQGFAYLLIGFGLFLLLSGDVIDGLWLAVIGFILNGSARGAVLQSEFTRPIEGLSVSDVMDREPVAIPSGLSVERALEEYFLRYRWPWFPVVDAAQRFKGLLERSEADAVPEVERNSSTVDSLLEATGEEEDQAAVREDDPLEVVLGNQALRRHGALAAVDSEGVLRGVITADAVGRALRERAAPQSL